MRLVAGSGYTRKSRRALRTGHSPLALVRRRTARTHSKAIQAIKSARASTTRTRSSLAAGRGRRAAKRGHGQRRNGGGGSREGAGEEEEEGGAVSESESESSSKEEEEEGGVVVVVVVAVIALHTVRARSGEERSAFLLAPKASMVRASSVCSFCTAKAAGVSPNLAQLSTSAPVSMSKVTTSAWPSLAARWSGVAPHAGGS
mmetsp:Transcript_33952/g.67530  ORF Transcript_33952/g.67530 Transcript_33952/m.67530 type:complete len:202 (-) Transcript_33952:254-859(-)